MEDRLNKDYYETVYIPDQNRDSFWEVFTKYLQRYIPEGSSILDVGAGYCNFINAVKAKERWAIDLNPNFTKYAGKDVNTIVGDCCKDMPGKKFDVIFSSNVFEHLPKEVIIPILKSLRGACKKRIIMFGPNYIYCSKHYWDDPTHLTALSHITLKRYVEDAGFEIEKIYTTIAPFSVQLKVGTPSFRIPKFLIWLYLHSPIKPFAGQMLIIAKVPDE